MYYNLLSPLWQAYNLYNCLNFVRKMMPVRKKLQNPAKKMKNPLALGAYLLYATISKKKEVKGCARTDLPSLRQKRNEKQRENKFLFPFLCAS